MEVALLHNAFSNEESGMDYPHSLKKKSIMKILCRSELVNKSELPRKKVKLQQMLLKSMMRREFKI